MPNVIPLYRPPLSRPFVRRLALAAALVALSLAAGVAFAGERAAAPADVVSPTRSV